MQKDHKLKPSLDNLARYSENFFKKLKMTDEITLDKGLGFNP